MGISSSSLLDESKSNYIRGRTEAELKDFSAHYRSQYLVAFFSKVQDEVEQQKTSQTQLLKQREPPKPAEVLYEENVLHFDDTRKWKERFVVVRANYSLECHDSYETFMKGVPPRHKLLPTGGTVLMSEEKYMVLVDKCCPDLNNVKEEFAPPMATMPGQFPLYLRLPYRRDSYFCFRQEARRANFISILTDCIRHQNQDFLKKSACEVQAFLKAIRFYRQEKGLYESWDMLIGSDVRVLANLLMEELLPNLQTELLPRLKGKKMDRKKAWFATMEAAYILVQEQLLKGLSALKQECRETAKQQEALIRSDMDQIITSQAFLAGKLRATVTESAEKFCSEHVQPYLASILEELMGPISFGFQEARLLCEGQMDQLCQDFQESRSSEELKQALEQLRKTSLDGCYQHVDVLQGQLQELHSRYNFSNCNGLVHSTQIDIQQLMENAVYTFEKLLHTTLKDNPAKPGTAMEKAKHRVMKQYDYDSSTIRKRIFQKTLLDITLPAIKKNLAPTFKPELQSFEQYIFADYSNFIQVENVYEDILLQALESEVSKVVKEAASLKKHNLFVDGTEMRLRSQTSLCEGRTPPGSASTSPARTSPSQNFPLLGNGQLESPKQRDTSTEITPNTDETVKENTLSISETEEDKHSVAEEEKGDTPITDEAEKEDTLSPAETQEDKWSAASTEKEDIPSAAEMQAETVAEATALQSDAPLPSPSTDSANEENPVDSTLSVSLNPLLTEAGTEILHVLVRDKVEIEDNGALTIPVQPPADTGVPSIGDSNAGVSEISFNSTEEVGDIGATTAEETDSGEEVTDSDVSLTSHPAAEGTEDNTENLSIAPISEVTEKVVCVHTLSTPEITEGDVVNLGDEPTTELAENSLPPAPVSPRVDSPAEVRPAEELEQVKVQAPDCVKEIRDLVVEIIEVEELVQRYPDSSA
ncbi:hypothetical protein AAFF_G00204290 [Aldrovandia affinis]|uniref:Niban 1/2/3 domain-containing protein n=1 Tax=Aldrovandia affinis TaxID=143900 RepID=A0AAD7RHV9_9TELE|nr:hypothetical protein AAFF_G00204290 [Aldrovandia affinis]